MIILILLAAAFVAGTMAGVLTLVALAIRHEDRSQLPAQAPTRVTAAARSLTGLRVSSTRPAPHAGLPATPGGQGTKPSRDDHAAPRPPCQALQASSS